MALVVMVCAIVQVMVVVSSYSISTLPELYQLNF